MQPSPESSAISRRARLFAAAWLAGLAAMLAAYAVVTLGEIGSERLWKAVRA